MSSNAVENTTWSQLAVRHLGLCYDLHGSVHVNEETVNCVGLQNTSLSAPIWHIVRLYPVNQYVALIYKLQPSEQESFSVVVVVSGELILWRFF